MFYLVLVEYLYKQVLSGETSCWRAYETLSALVLYIPCGKLMCYHPVLRLTARRHSATFCTVLTQLKQDIVLVTCEIFTRPFEMFSILGVSGFKQSIKSEVKTNST